MLSVSVHLSPPRDMHHHGRSMINDKSKTEFFCRSFENMDQQTKVMIPLSKNENKGLANQIIER